MQRSERERLLRRYMEGKMSVAEEENFLIEVALRKEVRLELAAQQTIDRALAKDRQAIDPNLYGLLQRDVERSLGQVSTSHSGSAQFLPGWRSAAGLLLVIGATLLLVFIDSPVTGIQPEEQAVEATEPSRDRREPEKIETHDLQLGDREEEQGEMQGTIHNDAPKRREAAPKRDHAPSPPITDSLLDSDQENRRDDNPTSSIATEASKRSDSVESRPVEEKQSDSINLGLDVKIHIP